MRPSAALVPLLAALLAGCLADDGPAPPEAPIVALRDDAWALLGSPPLDGRVRIVETGLEFYETTLGITKDGTFAVCCPWIPAVGTGTLGGISPATFVSRDGGATWTPAHVQTVGTSDPMLAVDPVTDRIYEFNMLGVSCSDLAFSDDGGATWMERPASCGAVPVFDFLKVAAGRPGPEANPAATGESVVYQCRNVNGGVLGLSSWCTMSYDGGLTWPVDVPVAVRPSDGCGGVTSWPAIGPDGTAVLPVGNGCPTFTMGVSRDSGLTWSIVRVPGEAGMMSVTPQAAFDEAGHLYVLWQDGDHRMNLARTDDLGETWHGPWNVTPPGAQALVFETLQAGAEGKAAFAIFASDQEPDSGISGVPDHAKWNLYLGTVVDGHSDQPSIGLYRAFPADDPVQVGPVCFGGGTCPRNHGDFIASAVAPDGAFHVAFVDGCVEDCVGDPEAMAADSQASEGRIAVADGFRLR